MSGARWSRVDMVRVIDQLQRLIEGCILRDMSKSECKYELQLHHNFDPELTEKVWNKIEEQNGEFFRAYHVRLELKEQITTFNTLLEQQARLMQAEFSVYPTPDPPATPDPPEVERSKLRLNQSSSDETAGPSDTNMSDLTSQVPPPSPPHN